MLNKTKKEIKKALPNIKSEKVDVLADELDRILTIKRIFQSEDGKELLAVLKGNCSSALRKAILAAKAGENPIAYILDYSSNIDLLGQIQDISAEKEIRDQLDEAVIEASRDIS